MPNDPVQPNDPTKQPDAPTGDALPTTLPDRPTDSTPPPISPPPANDPFPTSVPDPTSPPPATDIKDDKTESILPPVIPPPAPSRSKAKIVGALLAVLILVVSIPAGIFLVQRSQEIREKAAEPAAENIQVSQTYITSSNFGGSFLTGQDTSKTGNVYNSCLSPNRQTGDCSCRAGYQESVVVSYAGNHGWGIVCQNNSSPEDSSFGGVFRTGKDVSKTGNAYNSCAAANPITGNCSCLAGYTETRVGSWAGDNGWGIACQKNLPSNYSTFGGAFLTGKGESKNNGVYSPCQDSNPITGGCSCTSDYVDSLLGSWAGDNGGGFICQKAVVPTPEPTVAPTSAPPTPISAECINIKVYDANNNQLSADQLKNIKAGDNIKIAINGSTSSGTIDKARFRINSGAWQETTAKNSKNEYFVNYAVPVGTTNFQMEGMVHHQSLNDWF